MLMLISLLVVASVFQEHFNTSHVNVNPRRMCKCLSKIHISIHLTLMLITKRQSFIIAHTDFNTSHVNVNRWKALIFHLSKTNFNTSHVNVNPCFLQVILPLLPHFNTSHVNVNHTSLSRSPSIITISIHLMLMLIIQLSQKKGEYT